MTDLNSLFESILLESAMEAMRDRFHQDHGLHPDVFNHLYHNALPENNKSLGDMEWLANREVKGENVAENHETVKHIMTEFAKPAIKSKLQKKKANQYKTFQDLHDAVAPHLGTAPTKKEQEESDTKTIYKSDTHVIKQHMSHASAVKGGFLPENTPYKDVEMVKSPGGKCKATWCVSADSEEGKMRYSQYTEDGKIPFYTIEHSDKHPSMPNRKIAVLADPRRTASNHEVRDELQLSKMSLGEYALKNQSILHTEPGKYISGLIDLKKEGDNFSFKEDYLQNHVRKIEGGYEHTKGRGVSIQKYTLNDKFENHGPYEKNSLGGKEIGNYKNGKLHGMIGRYRNEGGMVNNVKEYNEGYLQSERHYNANGVPFSETHFDDKGRRTKDILFHDNGRVMRRSESSYINGKEHSTVKKYYESGQLKSEHNKIDLNEEGTYKSYHPSGNLKAEGRYINGNLHGIYKEYHDSGNVSSVIKYSNGIAIAKKFYEDSENVRDVKLPVPEHSSAQEYLNDNIGIHDHLISHSISENDNKIEVSKLVVHKDFRNRRIGTEFMKHLTDYADATGKKIVLSPSTDFGATSTGRLVKFYKKHGFVENKGRKKDFSISHTMYREPDKTVNESEKSNFRKLIEGKR